MRPFSRIAVSVVVSLVVCTCFGDEPQDAQDASFWMRKKLEYSGKILAGLANEDFDAIGKTARSMKALNQMEKWVRGGVPEYRSQLHIFQNANGQLIQMAEQKNLDGAALAYVQLTLSCVNCHKIVRDSSRHVPAEAK
jgi:hypothetical protein